MLDDVSAVKQCFPLTVSEVRMAGVSDSKLNNTLTDMIVSNKMLPFSQSDGIKAIRDIQKAYMADVIHDTQYFNDGRLSDGFVKNNSTKGKSLDGPALDDLLSKRAVMPPQYRSQMTF